MPTRATLIKTDVRAECWGRRCARYIARDGPSRACRSAATP